MKLLNPTAEVEAEAASMAAGLPSLEGRRVGLLDNGKVQVGRFYDHLEAMLREEYGVAEVVRRRKADASRPVPPPLLAELSACDAIVSAVGD